MSFFDDLNNWRKYRRTVSELNNLPDSVLKDIGVSRHSIDEYARKAVKKSI
ncbi:MAG: DUF1127 domain-containing protein [Pseudomonadota bacterium]